MGKLIITAAITGAFLSKEQHPALPVNPEEIRDEVKRCYNAGASIAHIHARHPDQALSDYEVLGMTLEIEIGRSLSRNVNVWMRPGVGVFGDIAQVYDWNLEGGLRYYFR